MWLTNFSHEKMRDGDMTAALLHSWFCAALHWRLGEIQVCAEQGQLAMKGLSKKKEKLPKYVVGGWGGGAGR